MAGEGSVTSNNAASKSKNQASIAKSRRWSSMLTYRSVTLVIAVIGVVVALLALSVSVVVYWQTADLASSGRPSTVTSDINQEDFAHFRQRLDDLEALIKQNANNYESQQQQFANTTAANGADMPAPSSMAVTSETDVPDKTRLDDVISRLEGLEAVRAKQSLVPAIPDRLPNKKGLTKPRWDC